ncbi:hypothetical protein [Microbacterium sp. RURRCA19A]|uniref:hypothetical protein n=1 Tax=Microbacterium sp. RURRCA19A TaxID=1907391 RepID=UPI000953D0E9|nr:hypothetical protein [Microbacterium sp. RURRCA19A]SIR56120.1 hypothetical protein SAMN05880568_0450 [Microbacterium sp. RURRCA19A]
MEQTAARPVPGSRLRGFSSAVVLVVGVLIVPMAITVAFTSWTSPDAHDYVRMAFAQVAGAVVAMITAVGLFIHRIIRRRPLRDTVWFGVFAAMIVAWQVSNLSFAADMLLQRLSVGV